MAIAVKLQGKKGMTAYQLMDGFSIGIEKPYDNLEYNDVGDLTAIHIKSYYPKGTKPK